MSTTTRLISGSASAWARILLTMITQVILVPVYLTYWTVQVYGIWIAIQALVTILSTLDRGHVDYLGYEFLKIGNENSKNLGRVLWPGLWLTLILGGIELILFYFFAFSSKLISFLGEQQNIQPHILHQAGWVLLFQWFGWTFFSNISGLFFRVLAPYGYYPRMGWWNFIIAIFTSIIPVFAVMTGANLIETGLWWLLSLIFISIPQGFDLFILLKKVKLLEDCGSLKAGLRQYKVSLALSGRYFLENFRQQGVRLILAPLSGLAGVAEFSTIRTGANVAQQGLLTITNPLLPELMRFLKERDQMKVEAAFGTIWMVLVSVLAPGVVLLQAIAPSLFSIWTKGQIGFNPPLFASLSLSVLVYALAQPAIAVVAGNNLLKPQIMISTVASITVLCSLILLVPILNILGAGLGLLIAEIIAITGFRKYAKRWLEQNSLYWPSESAKIASASVWVAGCGMLIMIYFPTIKLIILIATVIILLWNVRRYWHNIPDIAKDKVMSILERFPGLRKLKPII